MFTVSSRPLLLPLLSLISSLAAAIPAQAAESAWPKEIRIGYKKAIAFYRYHLLPKAIRVNDIVVDIK